MTDNKITWVAVVVFAALFALNPTANAASSGG